MASAKMQTTSSRSKQRARSPKAAMAPSFSSSSSATLSQISILEKQLLSTSTSAVDYNPLVDLLALLKSTKSNIKVRLAAAESLHTIFSHLIRQGRVIGKLKDENESLRVVKEWMRTQWRDYVETLCMLLVNGDSALSVRYRKSSWK